MTNPSSCTQHLEATEADIMRQCRRLYSGVHQQQQKDNSFTIGPSETNRRLSLAERLAEVNITKPSVINTDFDSIISRELHVAKGANTLQSNSFLQLLEGSTKNVPASNVLIERYFSNARYFEETMRGAP